MKDPSTLTRKEMTAARKAIREQCQLLNEAVLNAMHWHAMRPCVVRRYLKYLTAIEEEFVRAKPRKGPRRKGGAVNEG